MNYIVQIDRAHSAETVAGQLRDRGLNVERVLPRVGVVGGNGPRTLAASLRGVAGVSLVREEGGVQLPPFDPKVPQ